MGYLLPSFGKAKTNKQDGEMSLNFAFVDVVMPGFQVFVKYGLTLRFLWILRFLRFDLSVIFNIKN